MAMRRRSARIEPYKDADVGQLSAEFAQVILQVIAIAQRKYYSKIAALESKVSELRSSNQALEFELAQVKSRVLAANRQTSPVAEGASTLSSTDPRSLQRSDSIDQADQVSAADTDKDGIITVERLQTMGFDWPRKRKEMLLGALDEDGNGKVDLAEFVKGTEQLLAVLEKLHAMGVAQLAAKAEEHHEAPLPPALAAWEPIGKTAAVKEAAAGMKEHEAAFAREPSGEVAEALRSKAEQVEAALRSVIDQRVAEDKVAARCDAVIEAGGEAFTAVYDGVYKSIEVTEAEGMKALREELSDQRLAERVGPGGAKARQTKTGLMEVYADAAAARPLATEVVARVAAACGVEKAEQPPLKATLRMLEKVLLRPGASRGLCDTVCDCVRDMLTANSAAQLATLVRAFLDDEAIVVVRVKDRFKHPSGGGWRDVMINFYVVGDGAKHVCEVQLVHKSLLMARKGLPGHVIYGVVRNATEVLEFLGLLIKSEREARLWALMHAGWGREAVERLGLGLLPALTLEGHTNIVWSVCVTPDGLHVVTGSPDNTARVWLLADGARVRTLRGHTDDVYSVCVTPDGLHVVTGSADNTARVWLLADGSHVRTLRGHTGSVWSVCA